jgi:uncharacterized protein with NAD-binding domain and iron-sulfur cluster
VDAASSVGGLVRSGFRSVSGNRPAEAGQHGFWSNYHNIYRFFEELFGGTSDILTEYARQGQYSPQGLEAEWPVYREQWPMLPTGLAQLFYTRFFSLPLLDRFSALPLVLAFSEFDDSPEAWNRYDETSFRDLCVKLGVSERCYREAFEPMILTGLFAPGCECSAAAALGMAYFFVLQSQTAFDVQWCKGNIGDVIFQPWVQDMKRKGLILESATRVTGFEIEYASIRKVKCQRESGDTFEIETDSVILAVSGSALSALVRNCPELAAMEEFRRFAKLRGTSVLATRLYLSKHMTIPYSANACWGFHQDVGMTMFDIRALHGNNATAVQGCPGAVIEVDYYYANSLLSMSDDDIVATVKRDLDDLLGTKCQQSDVVDAAIVRLPNAVNWYFPGSYKDMPDLKSKSINNLYFAGDIVHTRHGSWSQEKAFVTGIQAVNLILGREVDEGVIPIGDDELHVKLGKSLVVAAKTLIGCGDPTKAPTLADFLW